MRPSFKEINEQHLSDWKTLYNILTNEGFKMNPDNFKAGAFNEYLDREIDRLNKEEAFRKNNRYIIVKKLGFYKVTGNWGSYTSRIQIYLSTDYSIFSIGYFIHVAELHNCLTMLDISKWREETSN